MRLVVQLLGLPLARRDVHERDLRDNGGEEDEQDPRRAEHPQQGDQRPDTAHAQLRRHGEGGVVEQAAADGRATRDRDDRGHQQVGGGVVHRRDEQERGHLLPLIGSTERVRLQARPIGNHRRHAHREHDARDIEDRLAQPCPPDELIDEHGGAGRCDRQRRWEQQHCHDVGDGRHRHRAAAWQGYRQALRDHHRHSEDQDTPAVRDLRCGAAGAGEQQGARCKTYRSDIEVAPETARLHQAHHGLLATRGLSDVAPAPERDHKRPPGGARRQKQIADADEVGHRQPGRLCDPI